MATKVVVTGLGATTPLGGDVATTWEGLLAGRSGTKPLPDEIYADYPARIAAPVAVEPTEVLSRVEARRIDRYEQFALVASREAWADAGLAGTEVDGDRLGVAVASGIGGLTSLIDVWTVLQEKGPRQVSPYTIPMIMPNGGAAAVGLDLGARAGVHAVVSACASSNEAIATGMEAIRSGRADIVVAGGAEAVIHPLPIGSFGAMRALSRRNDEPERASRPFDKARDGFVLGEGGAMLILESEESALRRGARIYAEVAGVGMSADSHHITQPDPDARGVSRAMRFAMENAGLAAEQVKLINAHATSTPPGDAAEARAIRTVFGDAANHLIVTAPKSSLGHLLGAAGAAESLATVLSLSRRIVPPTINLEDPDDEIDINVATTRCSLPEGSIGALNNSFGFGGHNVVVAFRSV